jgi:hypothetical protein
MAPDGGIFNSIIESDLLVVYEFRYCWRQNSVESLSVLAVVSEDISNGKVDIMYVNYGNQRTNQTM